MNKENNLEGINSTKSIIFSIIYLILVIASVVISFMSIGDQFLVKNTFYLTTLTFITGGYMKIDKEIITPKIWWVWGITASLWFMLAMDKGLLF